MGRLFGGRLGSGAALLAILVTHALLLALLPRPAAAMVSDTTLGRLSALSDRIFVGRVERVFVVPLPSPTTDGPCVSRPCRVAEIRPLRWVKGTSGGRNVFVLAEGTWTCDTSHAVPGEDALFFLEEHPADPAVPTPWLGPGGLCERVTGVSAIDRIAWSGHGRMPLRDVLGRTHAELEADVIRLPPGIETYPGEDPRFDDFVRTVPLEEILAAVEARLAPGSPPRDPLHARVEALVRLIDREEGEGRDAEDAADALAGLGEPALAILRALLADPASPLREAAGLALVLTGAEGWRALRADLASASPAARRAAAFAAFAGWLFLPEEAEAVLLGAAADADPEVRWPALRALARHESNAALPGLAAALEGADPDPRWHAAEALSDYMFPEWDYDDEPGMPEFRARAERALLAMAREESPRLRRAAFRALALVGGEASLPAIEAALRDGDPIVRINATHALGRIHTAEAAALGAALLGHEDPWLRRTAAVVLADAEAVAAVPALAAALADADRLVREAAADALRRIGPPAAAALPALEAALDRARERAPDSIEEWAIRFAIEAIRPPR